MVIKSLHLLHYLCTPCKLYINVSSSTNFPNLKIGAELISLHFYSLETQIKNLLLYSKSETYSRNQIHYCTWTLNFVSENFLTY